MSVKKVNINSTKRDWKQSLLVGLIVGLFCVAAVLFGVMQSWSRRISDRFYLSHDADSRIVVVAIDDASMSRLGRWPWPRAVHARLIEKLTVNQPLAIGYDVNFPESSDEKNDTALADALTKAGNVVLPVELELAKDKSSGKYEILRSLPPISEIASAAKRIGHTNTPLDTDGVARRVPIISYFSDGQGQLSFAAEIAVLATGSFKYINAIPNVSDFIINYPDRPKQAFEVFSASDVIDGRVGINDLKNKIVMVGATAPDLHDEQRVPTSLTQPMPGIEIHSSILDTILQQNYLQEVPKIFVALWVLLVCALMGFVTPLVKARWSIILVVILWIGSVIGAFVLFDKGWIMDILWPTIALVTAFAALMLERRISSDKQKKEIKTAFSHYVSSSVVASILENPDKLHLGGERKEMTVLFSDVRGFTTISEGLSPERLVELMNAYLTKMTDIVFKHEGVLDKYIGDAVMAFWNAPFDQTDHAKRAVETALDMLETLKKMNSDGEFGDIEFKIGVGINTGDMVVGNMGSHNRFDYTVIGDNVNLGSRMEALTKQYGVELLISESTKSEISEEEYLIRPIDLVAVKGKNEPVRMFEVMKRKADANAEDEEFLVLYSRALKDYFAKDFVNAVALSDELLSLRPNDGPSKTLNQRSKEFRDNPPGDGWNGVWVMKTK